MNYQLKFLEVYLIYHFECSCLSLHCLIQSQIDQSSYLLGQLDFLMFLRINYKIYHLLKSRLHCNKKFFHFYLLLLFIFIIYRKFGYFLSLWKMLVYSLLFSLSLFLQLYWNKFFFPLILLCSRLVKSIFECVFIVHFLILNLSIQIYFA